MDIRPLLSYERQFSENYDALRKDTQLKISTMTVVVELDIDVDFKTQVSDLPTFFKDYDAECVHPKGKKTGDEFMNQMTIRYKDESGKKNIKIFPNGKLHMTGIKHMKDVTEITSHISQFLNASHVNNVQICLMNCNFNMNMGIHLNAFAEILIRMDQEHTDPDLFLPFSFRDPNKYPGLRIKYSNVSILMFASGSIMIAGAKHIKDIHKCYDFVNRTIQEHYQLVNCPILKKKK